MERVKWYLKQLLPLKYKSHYYVGKNHGNPMIADEFIGDTENLAPVTCDFRMWMGRCFSESYSKGHV